MFGTSLKLDHVYGYFNRPASKFLASARREGFLHKEGHLVKSWKERYFVLYRCFLLYYESPSSLAPLGVLVLEECLCREVSLPSMTKQNRRLYGLSITGPNDKPFVLGCFDEIDRNKWISAINESSYYHLEALHDSQLQILTVLTDENKTLKEILRCTMDERKNMGNFDISNAEIKQQSAIISSLENKVIDLQAEIELLRKKDVEGNLALHIPSSLNNTDIQTFRVDRNVRMWVGTWNMGCTSVFKTASIADSDWILEPWIDKGCHIYVVGVQEMIGEEMLQLIEKFTGCRRVQIEDSSSRVLGRGDGSLVGQKSTSIAVYIARGFENDIEVISAASHSFGVTEGSKGGCTVLVRFFSSTTIAFVNAHLSSKSSDKRETQLQNLLLKLSSPLSAMIRKPTILTPRFDSEVSTINSKPSAIASVEFGMDLLPVAVGEGFDILGMFHHVILIGDLNTRVRDISADAALQMMVDGKVSLLKEQHDECGKLLKLFPLFQEPIMDQSFIPSYKKIPSRRGGELKFKVDHKNLSLVYRTAYQEPWYRSGQISERIPSWCDRILWSSADHLKHCLKPIIQSHTEPGTERQLTSSYRSVEERLCQSDHSPVCCLFELHTNELFERRYRVSMWNIYIHTLECKDNRIDIEPHSWIEFPKLLSVLFPLPAEGSRKPNEIFLTQFKNDGRVRRRLSTITRQYDTETKSGMFEWILDDCGRRQMIQNLHMCLRVVLADGVEGQCTTPVSPCFMHNPLRGSSSFELPLTRLGRRVTDIDGVRSGFRGNGTPPPIMLCFMLQIEPLERKLAKD